jgi:hypothetical protein
LVAKLLKKAKLATIAQYGNMLMSSALIYALIFVNCSVSGKKTFTKRGFLDICGKEIEVAGVCVVVPRQP